MRLFTPAAHSRHDRSAPEPSLEGAEVLRDAARKKDYVQPVLETVGSVPRLTGGSDIFGDTTSSST